MKRAGQSMTCLLSELSDCCVQCFLILIKLALWDRPGANVLILPEGPTRMYKEYLQLFIFYPVQQDTRTLLLHGFFCKSFSLKTKPTPYTLSMLIFREALRCFRSLEINTSRLRPKK